MILFLQRKKNGKQEQPESTFFGWSKNCLMGKDPFLMDYFLSQLAKDSCTQPSGRRQTLQQKESDYYIVDGPKRLRINLITSLQRMCNICNLGFLILLYFDI